VDEERMKNMGFDHSSRINEILLERILGLAESLKLLKWALDSRNCSASESDLKIRWRALFARTLCE
jgi:hypothetical protein